jgi:hypothetical protein
MFNSRQARMIRMAISPRLATRIFLNMSIERPRIPYVILGGSAQGSA